MRMYLVALRRESWGNQRGSRERSSRLATWNHGVRSCKSDSSQCSPSWINNKTLAQLERNELIIRLFGEKVLTPLSDEFFSLFDFSKSTFLCPVWYYANSALSNIENECFTHTQLFYSILMKKQINCKLQLSSLRRFPLATLRWPLLRSGYPAPPGNH